MARVKNLTDDELGWAGVTVPAGGVVEVAEGEAARMIGSNPGKFGLADEGNGAPGAKAGAGEVAAPAAPPGHKHYYRKSKGYTCRCGAARPETEQTPSLRETREGTGSHRETGAGPADWGRGTVTKEEQ